MSYCFQTPSQLVLMLDLINGGDLRYHIHNKGTFKENEVFIVFKIKMLIDTIFYDTDTFRFRISSCT